jgi:hypothetical protein
MVRKILFCCIFIQGIPSETNAQTTKQNETAIQAPKTNLKNPFVFNLTKNGKNYIKFGLNAQLWGRYTELNPGSRIGNSYANQHFDIVVRRIRIQMMGMLANKVYFHAQIGTNNVNFTQNPNATISVLDMLGEYRFNQHIHLGLGLNGWGAGTTRYSAQSSSSQLTVDSPIYQQNNISSTFGNRNLSAYVKGTFNRFNYRFVITNPYKQATNNLSTVSSISTRKGNLQLLGMLTYQFFEKESLDEPYNKATYLGSKKVLNIGIGYMYQAKAMWRLDENNLTDTISNDMKVLGIDLFYDAPLNEKGAALTVYLAYNNCDYGKNYTRMVATPNPASSGSGNGFLGIGTGNIFYSQIGFLFNKAKKEDQKGRFQIYGAAEVASLQALKTPITLFEGGINYYFTSKLTSKVTFGYQNRAVFSNTVGETKLVETTRKGMYVIQYQIAF